VNNTHRKEHEVHKHVDHHSGIHTNTQKFGSSRGLDHLVQDHLNTTVNSNERV
jgi:hypothetical protein